jgi:trans-2,3-dihydro-3-hydroxyanthranilate isomerase
MRIFAPESELPVAGHPVLGTAFVVSTALGKEQVVLETGVGPVPVQLELSNGCPVFGWMQQPVRECEPFERERELLDALGLTESRLPVELYRNGAPHVLVALGSEDEIAALKPDFAALAELDIAANCFAGSGLSWKTRMFYPSRGIPEDPATGSAAGPLALHLARHGRIGFGQEIDFRQGAELGRPSVLHAVARGSRDQVESVEVGGVALIVAQGVFRVAHS